MNSSRFSKFLSRRKVTIAIAASVLLFVGVAANGADNKPTTIDDKVSNNPWMGTHHICVNKITSSISDGGIGENAKCDNTSLGFTVDSLPAINPKTKTSVIPTPFVYFCKDSKTKKLFYGGSGGYGIFNTSFCKTNTTNFLVPVVDVNTRAKDVHLICLGKTGELKYSGFGKIAKCNSSFYTYFGVANKTETIRFEMGSSYLLCTDLRTQVVTHPLMGSLQQCGWNDVSFVVGANGQAGKNGLDGKDGIDGKTLWNGTKDPESSWGAPGDMYINSTTKTLFGPKGVDGTWPAGVSIVGPKGDQGPIGLTGAAGPQGPGGSGPAGATGATGTAGATGAAGAPGAPGTNGTNGLDGAGASIGFTRSRQANIELNNADTQWESFIEVVKMSGLGNGKYFFNSSVAINGAAAVVICYVYGGDTGAGSLNAYGMNTSTIAQNGFIQISGANDFISLRCGKTGVPTITAQYPVLTAIKLDTVTVKNG